jgi:hypothetical protein
MNPKSASALAWLAAMALVLGTMIGSPAGQRAAYVVAASLAAVPAWRAGRKTRIAAIAVVALALLMIAVA